MILLKSYARPLPAGQYVVKDTLNHEFVAESLKRLANELGFTIVDNSSRHAKAVYYMMLDEFDQVGCLHFLQGDGFRLFGEVIGYSQDESMSF